MFTYLSTHPWMIVTMIPAIAAVAYFLGFGHGRTYECQQINASINRKKTIDQVHQALAESKRSQSIHFYHQDLEDPTESFYHEEKDPRNAQDFT